MSRDYIERTYGVSFHRGDRVTIDSKPGTIVSFPGQYLGVRLDAHPKRVTRAHPTWRVEVIKRRQAPNQQVESGAK